MSLFVIAIIQTTKLQDLIAKFGYHVMEMQEQPYREPANANHHVSHH